MKIDEKSETSNDDADHSDRVKGISYVKFLDNFQKLMKPANYFEVGTQRGGTLRLATCPAIAVDPQFILTTDVIGSKSFCLCYQQPSDKFFREQNPSQLFGAPVDLAFLDGMHLFEFLLRDFINTERHCRRNSVIALHDCLPPGFYMTVRDPGDTRRNKSRFKEWWTGDVWKVVKVLFEMRRDLSITVLDCAPTGLVLITNLNSADNALEKSYDQIIEKYVGLDSDRASYDNYWANIKITSAAELMTFEQLSRCYWF